jgi:hypothetical protein
VNAGIAADLPRVELVARFALGDRCPHRQPLAANLDGDLGVCQDVQKPGGV